MTGPICRWGLDPGVPQWGSVRAVPACCGRAGQAGSLSLFMNTWLPGSVWGGPGLQGEQPWWARAVGSGMCRGVCPPRVRVPTTVAVRPGCELGHHTNDEAVSFTSQVRREGLGLLWVPTGGQSLPMGLRPVLAGDQEHASQAAHSHPFRKEPLLKPSCRPWAPCPGGRLPAVGAGQEKRWGTPSLFPWKEHPVPRGR